jgi:hypothetical protein
MDLQAIRYIGSNALRYSALGCVSSRKCTLRLKRRHWLLNRYISFDILRETSQKERQAYHVCIVVASHHERQRILRELRDGRANA